jgi:hypothetical protein
VAIDVLLLKRVDAWRGNSDIKRKENGLKREKNIK